MAVMCEEENRCLTAAVSGELDHHRAKEVMEELEEKIRAHYHIGAEAQEDGEIGEE